MNIQNQNLIRVFVNIGKGGGSKDANKKIPVDSIIGTFPVNNQPGKKIKEEAEANNRCISVSGRDSYETVILTNTGIVFISSLTSEQLTNRIIKAGIEAQQQYLEALCKKQGQSI